MNAEEQLTGLLKELSIQNYSDEATNHLLAQYPLQLLLKKLLNGDITSESMYHLRSSLERIFEKQHVFTQLLTNPEVQPLVLAFISNQSEDHREFIATVITQNPDLLFTILDQNAADSTQTAVTDVLRALYGLLGDTESQAIITKLAKIIGIDERLNFLANSELAKQLIGKLITDSDAVVEIRTFETLVQMGNANPRFYSLFEQNGFITAGLDLYRKYFDEILEKMNIVDIISQLGSTEVGCNILCSHQVFKVIKKEALAKDTDPFVAKSLGILLIELVNHEQVPYSFLLFKDLRIRLEEMFVGGFGEELHACFDMIRAFGKSVEGFTLVFQTKPILAKLSLCCNASKENEQRRALEAILGLLEPNKKYVDASKKGKTKSLAALNEDGRAIEFLLVYMASPKLVNSVIDLNDEVYLTQTMTFVFDNLFLPFIEIELLMLLIMRNAIEVENILNAFLKSARSLDYLHTKQAKSKEIFDAKNDFKKLLLHKINFMKDSVKDSFYELYLKEYKIKEQQKRQELLQYATDTG